VVWRTFERRGKSETPASRVFMEESRRARDSRRDETQPSKEWAIVVVVLGGYLATGVSYRCCD
jgi:hypothetical protein